MLNIWLLKYYNNICKKKKNAWTLREILFLSHGQENDFLLYWMVYWFFAQFVSKQAMVPKVYALSRSYLELFGYFRFFSILCPKCALVALNNFQIGLQDKFLLILNYIKLIYNNLMILLQCLTCEQRQKIWNASYLQKESFNVWTVYNYTFLQRPLQSVEKPLAVTCHD